LPVSVPSHCPLMQPAADRFRAALAEVTLAAPGIPVLHNVDVATHAEPAAIREALTQQLCGSVRWAETVSRMAAQAVERFVECGPGRVLAGLNKRIVPAAQTEALFDPASFTKALGLVS